MAISEAFSSDFQGSTSRPPYRIDLQEIARANGIQVVAKYLPDTVSGKIERDGDNYRITLNALHSPVRQRFTLAHEIAHYMLHRDKIGDGIVDNALYRSDSLSNEQERQANRLAASIIMPGALVREAWKNGFHTAEALAHEFGVSKSVAEIRMRELGCVLWPK